MNRYHRWYCQSARWRSRLTTEVLPWVLGDASLGEDALEVGPGPGLTTDLLRLKAEHLTCLEVDEELAARLARRTGGTNVTVVPGDATAMPFDNARFSAAISLTMLHHVPSADLQDRLFAELFRVLAPGGWFFGSDSTASIRFRLNHLFDTGVPIDPVSLPDRLVRAGFTDVRVDSVNGAFRFRGRRA